MTDLALTELPLPLGQDAAVLGALLADLALPPLPLEQAVAVLGALLADLVLTPLPLGQAVALNVHAILSHIIDCAHILDYFAYRRILGEGRGREMK